MAMFPNATHGYMPFLQDKKSQKRSKPHVNGSKLQKAEKKAVLSATQKMYQITLKDRKGNTYKCIVKADGTKSLPELCPRKSDPSRAHKSMSDISKIDSPSKQRQILAEKLDALNSLTGSDESFSTSLDLRNCGKKESVLSTIIRFFKSKTEKSAKESKKESKSKSNGKSKRKPREVTQRKRQRTVSAMSNLDPIEESPNEQEYEEEDFSDDNESYTHFSSSCSSDCDSVSSHITCSIEQVIGPGNL